MDAMKWNDRLGHHDGVNNVKQDTSEGKCVCFFGGGGEQWPLRTQAVKSVYLALRSCGVSHVAASSRVALPEPRAAATAACCTGPYAVAGKPDEEKKMIY